MPSSKDSALIAVCGTLWLLALLFAQSSGRTIADESVHIPQVQWFLQGRFEAHPLLTTIPGYHLLVVAALKALSTESVAAMRAVGAGIGVACALVFWLIRRRLGDPHASRSAALLFFLTFLFPYYYIFYTDVLPLLLVLCALLATLERRHGLARPPPG